MYSARAPRTSRHFYPRPLRGGRHKTVEVVEVELNISIHALCEEGDGCSHGCRYCFAQFLSTPSARRATWRRMAVLTLARNFYPRPLRGGRPLSRRDRFAAQNFYPRPLRGGRRGPRERGAVAGAISIHALCEEGDLEVRLFGVLELDFYPRPLRGGRQAFSWWLYYQD